MSSEKEHRDNIHESVEMVDNHSREPPTRMASSASGKNKKKKVRPFLTSSQLSDLFTRLDKNGDGELDLDEFTGIIRMLKLNVSEDYIAKVFRAVDTEASGTLEMQEFICAYQKIYCNSEVVEKTKASAEFIRATRYGVDETGTSIYTVFTIMNHDGKTEGRKIIFNIGKNPENNLKPLEHYYNSAVTEKFVGGMDEINKMIVADSHLNSEHNCRLLWWVDIALEWVERSNVNKYVAAFGLPNNSKFLASFGSFGNALPKDKKSRVFVGDGVTESGSVSSMNVFAQTTRLKNRPVVHHLPSWLEKVMSCGNNSLFDFIGNYYISRFAFMFNLSMFSDTNKNEKMVAYEIAETMSHRLREELSSWNDDEEGEEDDQAKQARGKKGNSNEASYSILKSGGKSVPLQETERHRTQPTWTLSNSQLQASPPTIGLETIGFHILDQGSGPNALVTIRRIDGERRNDLNWEEKSRCGVLGRMLDGVWTKLFEVTCSGGIAVVAGEIDDSSHTLASFILMLTHSFSMATLGSLDYWINIIEKEIKDMVVSKHSTHVAEMERLIKELSTYVDPCLSVYDEFLKDCEKEYSKTHEMNNASKAPKKRGRSVLITDPSLIGASTPANSDKLPITYNLVKRFNGDAAHRDFRFVLEGYELLDMKGLIYWRERLDRYSQKLNATKDLIQNQLDEKRNFTTFMLTIVTTVLAPLAVLTGYFGMNFDNMDELASETYQYAPGVTLMWVIAGITYGLMLIFSVHFRIIYSAT